MSCLLEINFSTTSTFQSKRCMKYVTFNWIYILKVVKQNQKIVVVKETFVMHHMNKRNSDICVSLYILITL